MLSVGVTNGLAFRIGGQLYILQGSVVKDTSSSPVDLKVTARAPASATTGTSFATQFQVANLGPNSAQGVSFSAALPVSVIYCSVTPSAASSSGAGTVYCSLGTISSGATVTVTLNGTPTTSGAIQITGAATTLSFDSNNVNNQTTASTTVTGALYSLVPAISALSPNSCLRRFNIHADSHRHRLYFCLNRQLEWHCATHYSDE